MLRSLIVLDGVHYTVIGVMPAVHVAVRRRALGAGSFEAFGACEGDATVTTADWPFLCSDSTASVFYDRSSNSTIRPGLAVASTGEGLRYQGERHAEQKDLRRTPTSGRLRRPASRRRESQRHCSYAVEAIELARELNPGISPHVERVRNTSAGHRDKWRKP